MNLLFVLVMVQGLFVSLGWADGDREHEVPPNYFREFYIGHQSIKDLPVSLDGEWTDAQVKRLAKVLSRLNAERPRRSADIGEWPYFTRLVFRVGEAFAYDRYEQHFTNPAAIWGNGISGDITHTYSVPMGASDEEIMAALGPRLPVILIKDP